MGIHNKKNHMRACNLLLVEWVNIILYALHQYYHAFKTFNLLLHLFSCWLQIKDGFAEGKDLVVTVMSAMGEEQICALKDIGPRN
jgi:hypothetical protein